MCIIILRGDENCKDKFSIEQDNLLLMLLIFEDGMIPKSYLIHSMEWSVENDLFSDREYRGLKSMQIMD